MPIAPSDAIPGLSDWMLRVGANYTGVYTFCEYWNEYRLAS